MCSASLYGLHQVQSLRAAAAELPALTCAMCARRCATVLYQMPSAPLFECCTLPVQVGGEFPVAASSASERAEGSTKLQKLRGQTVVLVFSMQVSHSC